MHLVRRFRPRYDDFNLDNLARFRGNFAIMKTTIRVFFTSVLFVGLSLAAPNAGAVVPPPDGGYPGGNTAEGQNALLNLTTGGFNTAVGFFSLRNDTIGSFNTGVLTAFMELKSAVRGCSGLS